MAQDQIQYQPAFSHIELALFEGNLVESGNYTVFFEASSQSGLFLLTKKV